MPILNQGRLSAVLYLENTLATNVFTPERLHVLNILSSQIAVAIDNARLYENLEQKVEERTIQLKNAQEENLKKAHRAGMADIAKETLHNVGNILNSIKTIADTINKHTVYSALSGMTSANQILKEHMENLQNSLADDPRGIKIMDYYSALETFFYDEKDLTDRQINRLRRKVDEIVTVIQELQNHIGTDDAYQENIRLKEEVKFVLETKRDNLASENIKIMEVYNDVPLIRAQKSKLAYILDTLITNAKEAMENAPEEKKVISIEITKLQAKVILNIHDNGNGIPKENIQRIFFHGFTTKTGRTGHSLHNCANSMTEIGGKIFAQSNGAGKGTTFTLEFPIL